MDESVFFRESTVRICGSLEMEIMLRDFLMYIRQYIPADNIYFTTYEPNLGIMGIDAMGDIRSLERVFIRKAVPPNLRKMLLKEKMEETKNATENRS